MLDDDWFIRSGLSLAGGLAVGIILFRVVYDGSTILIHDKILAFVAALVVSLGGLEFTRLKLLEQLDRNGKNI